MWLVLRYVLFIAPISSFLPGIYVLHSIALLFPGALLPTICTLVFLSFGFGFLFSGFGVQGASEINLS